MINIKNYQITELEGNTVTDAINGYPEKLRFNDRMFASQCNRLSKIAVYSCEFVDGIEFVYDDGITCGVHGNYQSKNELVLSGGEYVTEVEWETYDRIKIDTQKSVVHWIKCKTNKGNIVTSSSLSMSDAPAGTNPITHKFTVSDVNEEEIFAFAGYAGSSSHYLYSITKIYTREINPEYSYREEYFDDYYSILNCRRLAKIRVGHGWVIDRLQFIYTNEKGEVDEAVCPAHGIGPGGIEEIVLGETEYISKMVYKLCNAEYFYPEKIMYYLEFTVKDSCNPAVFRVRGFGNANFEGKPVSERLDWKSKHRYAIEADEGYEIFALAGYFVSYMGRISCTYHRKLGTVDPLPAVKSARASAAAPAPAPMAQINSNGAAVLFIFCDKTFNAGGKLENDKIIKTLRENFIGWKSSVSRAFPAAMYAQLDSSASRQTNTTTNVNIQNAILAPQFEYISIFAHGQRLAFGGTTSAFYNPISSDWLDNPAVNKKTITQEALKDAFKNKVFKLMCCMCGYRQKDNGRDGLAVKLVNKGALACFAYSVSIITPIAGAGKYIWLKEFTSFIDDAMIIGVDKSLFKNPRPQWPDKIRLTPNQAARYALKKFDDILSDMEHTLGLDKKVIDAMLAAYPAESAERPDFDDMGYYIGTADSPGKLREYLTKEKKITNEEKLKHYGYYWGMARNKKHFCAPGKANLDRALKNANLGQNCKEFGNYAVAFDNNYHLWGKDKDGKKLGDATYADLLFTWEDDSSGEL